MVIIVVIIGVSIIGVVIVDQHSPLYRSITTLLLLLPINITLTISLNIHSSAITLTITIIFSPTFLILQLILIKLSLILHCLTTIIINVIVLGSEHQLLLLVLRVLMMVEWVYAELRGFFYSLEESSRLFISIVVMIAGVVIFSVINVSVSVVVMGYRTVKVMMPVVGELGELLLVLTNQHIQLSY